MVAGWIKSSDVGREPRIHFAGRVLQFYISPLSPERSQAPKVMLPLVISISICCWCPECVMSSRQSAQVQGQYWLVFTARQLSKTGQLTLSAMDLTAGVWFTIEVRDFSPLRYPGQLSGTIYLSMQRAPWASSPAVLHETTDFVSHQDFFYWNNSVTEFSYRNKSRLPAWYSTACTAAPLFKIRVKCILLLI